MIASRWPADGPLWLLVGLGSAFLVGLGSFVARLSVPYDPFVACETFAATALARVGTLALIVPAAVISVVVVATLLALGHQSWVTWRVLARVLKRRRPPSARLVRLARQVGVAGRLDVVADADVYTFCHGFLRPRVCVTDGLTSLLADDELAAVLRHEAHHVQHSDPVKILLSRATASGLFFLPLAGALRDGFLAGKEICADADAVADGGELPLARALVKLLHAECPSWPAGVLAVGAFSPTEARLQRLVHPDRRRSTLPAAMDWIVSLALVAGIFGFSYGAAAAGQAAPVHAACPAAIALASPGAGHLVASVR